MNYIFLSLLAPAVFSMVNYVDKYVVEHQVRDYRGMPVYGALTGLLIGTIVWLLLGFPVLSMRDGFLVILSGMLSLFGYALYFQAISKAFTSYVIAILQSAPVFTLIFAFLLLGERLSQMQLLGIGLVIISSLGMSLKKEEKKFRLDAAFWLILLADLFFSLSAIVIKFTISLNGFAPILIYESWGIALGGMILVMLFPTVRIAFRKSFQEVGRRVLVIMFINEGFFIIAKAITFFAVLLGSVSIVNALGGTQVFYGIFFGVVLSSMAPSHFKEERQGMILLKKLLFAVVLFCGLGIICFSI